MHVGASCGCVNEVTLIHFQLTVADSTPSVGSAFLISITAVLMCISIGALPESIEGTCGLNQLLMLITRTSVAGSMASFCVCGFSIMAGYRSILYGNGGITAIGYAGAGCAPSLICVLAVILWVGVVGKGALAPATVFMCAASMCGSLQSLSMFFAVHDSSESEDVPVPAVGVVCSLVFSLICIVASAKLFPCEASRILKKSADGEAMVVRFIDEEDPARSVSEESAVSILPPITGSLFTLSPDEWKVFSDSSQDPLH